MKYILFIIFIFCSSILLAEEKLASGVDLNFITPPIEVQKAIDKKKKEKLERESWVPPILTEEMSEIIFNRLLTLKMFKNNTPKTRENDFNREIYFNALTNVVAKKCKFKKMQVFEVKSKESNVWILPQGIIFFSDTIRSLADNEAEFMSLLLMQIYLLDYPSFKKIAISNSDLKKLIGESNKLELEKQAEETLEKSFAYTLDQVERIKADNFVVDCLEKSKLNPKSYIYILKRLNSLAQTNYQNSLKNFITKNTGLEYRIDRLEKQLKDKNDSDFKVFKKRYNQNSN